MADKRGWIGWTTAGVLWFAFAVFGVFHLSPWAAAWDEVDFVLAIDRFDLLAMQPHAPGYPYFILGGRFMRLFTAEPVSALGLWNLVLVCSSAYPIYRIARRWTGPLFAALAAALVLTLPMNWTLAVRPMSEGAALALLWWFLWTLVRLGERRTESRWLVAVLVFGLLMGTRLSYAPFGLGLLLIWCAVWRDPKLSLSGRIWRALRWGLIAIAFQLLWLAGVAAAEGGISGTLVLLTGFGEGHFTQWGGGVSQSGVPIGPRIYRFVAQNWLWTGVWAQSAVLAVIVSVIAAAITTASLAGWRRSKANTVVIPLTQPCLAAGSAAISTNEQDGGHLAAGSAAISANEQGCDHLAAQSAANPDHATATHTAARRRNLLLTAAGLIAVSVLAYALWALLGQNIAKPRHAAPLATLTLFWLAVAAARRLRPAVAASLLILLLIAQAFAGTELLRLQQTERPAVYQLADWLNNHTAPQTIVYTWEEERVLGYLNVSVQTEPIFTYDYFIADISARPGARILLTGSVWEEFRRQRQLPESQVRRIGVFHSDTRLDPVYGTIVLYEWNRG